MSSLSLRLGLWYAAIFALLLLLVVGVSSLMLNFRLAHETRERLLARVGDVVALGKAYGSNVKALSEVAPSIAQDFANLGVDGAVFDTQGNFLAGDPAQKQAGAAFAHLKHAAGGTPGSPTTAPQANAWGPAGRPPGPGGVEESDGLRVLPYPGGYLTIAPMRGFDILNLGQYWVTLLILVLVALVLAFVSGRMLAGQALKPVDEVTVALRSLAGGDFSRRAFVRGEKNEAGALAGAYNAAVERVANALEERRHTEERMRQFSADAGHELRTPLTVISGYVSVLRRGAVGERAVAEDILATISDECERMRQLINKLMLLSRLDSVPPTSLDVVDVSQVVHDAVESARPLVNGDKLTVSADVPLKVRADTDELREAVRNLIDNARKYAPGAAIEVSARRDNSSAVIDVRDDGPGMPAEEQTHAFERFYRGATRDVPGSGLGLAIVKMAAERAGGTATLSSGAGKGTRVTIKLPLVKE
ncbi:MAG TPA: HAMP domain-containing sensor histidine kinase [Candidatus Tumulicola sp.]|nr:HAMP domain-containing sensor histidine kinase [Candidatus Tumulicola sp.]